MIDIYELGVGSDGSSVNLRLICHACHTPLTSKDAWLIFAPPGKPVQPPPLWAHKGCVSGQLTRLLGVERTVMWRAADALQRLAEGLNATIT